MFFMFRLAFPTIEIMSDITAEFNFESWVDFAKEFLRIERKVIAIVQTFIVFLLIASGFELLEPDVFRALHQEVFRHD